MEENDLLGLLRKITLINEFTNVKSLFDWYFNEIATNTRYPSILDAVAKASDADSTVITGGLQFIKSR